MAEHAGSSIRISVRRTAARHVRLPGRLALLGAHPPARARRRPPGRDTDAEAGILRSLGALYRELGRYDEAVTVLTRAAAIFEGHADQRRWAAVLRNLGDTYRYQAAWPRPSRRSRRGWPCSVRLAMPDPRPGP